MPKIAGGADGLLFGTIVNEPDFRAVALRSVADKNNFDQGFVGLKLDFVMQLRNEWPKLLEKTRADQLQIRLS